MHSEKGFDNLLGTAVIFQGLSVMLIVLFIHNHQTSQMMCSGFHLECKVQLNLSTPTSSSLISQEYINPKPHGPPHGLPSFKELKDKHLTVKTLGFRLSQLHQCGQGVLPNRLHYQEASLVTLPDLSSQKSYLATFLAFVPQTMQPRNSGQMCKLKATNLTRNADLYAF